MTAPRKSTFLWLLPLSLLLLSLFFPSVTREGVEAGLLVALGATRALLVPMVLGNAVLSLAVGRRGQRALPYLLGLLCGFPTGANLTAKAYENGGITKKEANFLLFFANNASLPFLYSFGGGRGLLLFFMQLLLTLPFFLFFLLKKKKQSEPKERLPVSFSSLFAESLRRSGETLVFVACCIVFFSFLARFFLFACPPLQGLRLWVLFFTEISGGMAAAKSASLVPMAVGVGFGGLSVHLQTAGLLSRAGLSSKSHFLGKLFLALAMGLDAYFLQKLL